MNFVPIGKLTDFPEGKGTPVRVGPRRIAVYRIGEELFAVKDICPHEGDPLHRAPPEDGVAVCRSHGWRFDLRTGACLRGDKKRRIAVYPVKVEGDDVLIGLG